MLFVLSKVVWFLTAPSNVLLSGLALGWMLRAIGWEQAGSVVLAIAGAGLALAVCLPVGIRAARRLENRFPRAELDADLAGIVVLGGSTHQRITAERGEVALGASAERLTMAITLARRLPRARLLFTGGSAEFVEGHLPKEADVAARFWRELGFDTGRVLFERRSRNTRENAVESRRLVGGDAERPWLLVTSAMHMPRAVGCFRRAGWRVVAFPVDYRTMVSSGGFSLPSAARRLSELDDAAREWLGLIAYRRLGWTGALFPKP